MIIIIIIIIIINKWHVMIHVLWQMKTGRNEPNRGDLPVDGRVDWSLAMAQRRLCKNNLIWSTDTSTKLHIHYPFACFFDLLPLIPENISVWDFRAQTSYILYAIFMAIWSLKQFQRHPAGAVQTYFQNGVSEQLGCGL